MVDVFGGTASYGGQRGPRGSMGPTGLAGSIADMCEWMPGSVVKNLQKYDELGCYFVDDKKIDLKEDGGKVTEWLSRCDGGANLKVVKDIKSVEKYLNRYVLNLAKSRLGVEDIDLLANTPGTSGFVCVTFNTSGDVDQVLLSNYGKDHQKGYHEVCVSTSNITITINDHVEIIQHKCRKWTTLFISYASDAHTTHYQYDVSGLTGSFTGPVDKNPVSGLSVGSRSDNTKYLTGQISCLEIYTRDVPTLLPHPIQRVLVQNQERL